MTTSLVLLQQAMKLNIKVVCYINDIAVAKDECCC